jgi:branched-chain amino acid transport system ATP-binding protein
MLEVHSLAVSYRGVRALQGVSLRVGEGEIVAVLGANGAGKSTLLRAISGLVRPHAGRILFRDREITGAPPDRIVRMGIAHCPEGRQLFPEMSVEEHLQLGAYTRRGPVHEDLSRVFELFPVLRARRKQVVSSLSGGEQQMVAIARALMSDPRVLLFDEPTMGLAPRVAREVARTVQALRDRGKTILLVEQNVSTALHLADRGYVLENGRIVAEGPAPQLASSDLVKRAYLGG